MTDKQEMKQGLEIAGERVNRENGNRTFKAFIKKMERLAIDNEAFSVSRMVSPGRRSGQTF